MKQEITETKKFFKNHQIELSDYWLESCIDWFHQENGNAHYTTKDLLSRIYEQWLLLDLRDVEVPQLPPNVKNEKKIVLNKSLSLQMMSIIDISKPKLSQLQKIKNLNALTRGFEDDKEFTPTAKRMLQLTLTDGVQEIKAIEYKTIPTLNINLTPGIKIKINSPVIIRRGQIMLEQYNFKLLGGEVEEISISHAVENVLASHLHLPQNPNPNRVDESSLEKPVNESQNINTFSRNIPVNQMTNNVNQNQVPANEQIIDLSEEEEELRLSAEVEMLELESNIFEEEMQYAVKENSNKSKELEEKILQETNAKKTIKVYSSPAPNDKKIKSPLNSSLELDDDIFNSPKLENHLSKIEKKNHTPVTTNIKDILDKIQNKKYGKYIIQAKFKSIIKKTTITDNKWTVELSVTDNFNELAVYMHTDIVATMAGCTAEATLNLRKGIENQNDDARNRLLQVLSHLKDELIKLDCLMEIEYLNDEVPIFISKLL